VPRPERFLYPAALLCAALIGLGLLRRDKPVLAAAKPPVAAGSDELKSELASLFQDLAAFRSGDDARLPAMRERAARICQHWQRCDVVDIVGYYAGLDRAARLRGLEDDRRGAALRERVSAAEHDALDQDAWQQERVEILAGLEELVGSIPPAGDRVPAAYAAALAAHLRVEHLRRAEWLTQAEREDELKALDRDLACSQETFGRAGMRRPRIELDWIQGVRAGAESRSREAESRLEHCLDEARFFDDRDWQGRALEELHGLAVEAGDLPHLEALIGELAALDAPRLTWGVARRYADLLIWNDQTERAADFLRTHVPDGKGERDEHALRVGQCLLRAGDVERALAAFAGIGSGSGCAREARLCEARALLARGSNAEALARIESAGAGRASDPGQRGYWLTLHAEVLLALGRRTQAIRELGDALEAAASAQASLFQERDASHTTNVFGELLGLHAVELLARAELEQGDALGAACTIESAQSSTLHKTQAKFSRGDMVAWAKHFELGLLTWVVGANESLVVYVAPDGSARGEKIAHGRRALQEAVRRMREAVLAGDEHRRESLGGELCAALLPGTLREELVARGGTSPARLCFLLHGPLEALPLEALEDGAWLTETIVPVVLPGLPESAPRAAWEASDALRWRLLGDPRGTEGEHLLPGAAEELDGIAQLRPEALRASDGAFDRKQLTAALGSGDCLHIATHVRHGGSLESRTDEARFVLSDGGEFGIDELAGSASSSALVVLTGCETGGGRFADSLGLRGLARVFLEGGTRNLVATSWPVEDRWARSFALALHRSLALGFAPSRACAEARRSLRAQGAPSSEWAAFRLLGQD
jgi:CHAT domain-containing protein